MIDSERMLREAIEAATAKGKPGAVKYYQEQLDTLLKIKSETPQFTRHQVQEELRLARGVGDKEGVAHWMIELDKIKKREANA